MLRIARWTCWPVVLIAVVAGCDLGQPSSAQNGSDDEDKETAEGCKYIAGRSVQNFHEGPIPAGFFDFDDRTCAAFGDVINYVGQPINEPAYGEADTIVRRDGDPVSPSDPVGTQGTVGIGIAALNLVSTEPITVLCDGEPTEWNVSVDLSDTPAPEGMLTATKEHANGGTAESVIFLYPRLTFTFVDDPTVVRVLDIATTGWGPVRLDATFPWAHARDPNDPELGSQFLIGVDGRLDTQTQRAGGFADPASPPRADPTCIRHVSPRGDYEHETCPVIAVGT